MMTEPSTTTLSRLSPTRLTLSTLLVGLGCGLLAVIISVLGPWFLHAPDAAMPPRLLLRGMAVVLVPGGMAGVVALRSYVNFDTRRGAFWTVAGTVGFMAAAVAYPGAARVDSIGQLVAWLGAWLATTFILGAPPSWWAGRS